MECNASFNAFYLCPNWSIIWDAVILWRFRQKQYFALFCSKIVPILRSLQYTDSMWLDNWLVQTQKGVKRSVIEWAINFVACHTVRWKWAQPSWIVIRKRTTFSESAAFRAHSSIKIGILTICNHLDPFDFLTAII